MDPLTNQLLTTRDLLELQLEQLEREQEEDEEQLVLLLAKIQELRATYSSSRAVSRTPSIVPADTGASTPSKRDSITFHNDVSDQSPSSVGDGAKVDSQSYGPSESGDGVQPSNSDTGIEAPHVIESKCMAEEGDKQESTTEEIPREIGEPNNRDTPETTSNANSEIFSTDRVGEKEKKETKTGNDPGEGDAQSKSADKAVISEINSTEILNRISTNTDTINRTKPNLFEGDILQRIISISSAPGAGTARSGRDNLSMHSGIAPSTNRIRPITPDPGRSTSPNRVNLSSLANSASAGPLPFRLRKKSNKSLDVRIGQGGSDIFRPPISPRLMTRRKSFEARRTPGGATTTIVGANAPPSAAQLLKSLTDAPPDANDGLGGVASTYEDAASATLLQDEELEVFLVNLKACDNPMGRADMLHSVARGYYLTSTQFARILTMLRLPFERERAATILGGRITDPGSVSSALSRYLAYEPAEDRQAIQRRLVVAAHAEGWGYAAY